MSLSVEENLSYVEIRKVEGAHTLFRNGEPFYIKGACGFENLDRLVECGANSLRTWATDQTLPILNDLRRLDLTFCAGLWLEPERRGFDYLDTEKVVEQRERILSEVDQLKDEDGLLLWGIGNELDLESKSPAVWDAIEDIACEIKKRDPRHPIITVIASAREETLRAISKRCPSLDAIGVNSYADVKDVIPSLDAFGWDRPYILTEWGPSGSWEVRKSPWGAPLEPSSVEKAEQVRERHGRIVSDWRRCIGNYAFFWGNKQETTHTWFNLFDPDKGEYQSVGVLSEFWGSQSVTSDQYPVIESLRVNGTAEYAMVESNSTCEVSLEFGESKAKRISVDWILFEESTEKGVGGDFEPTPKKLDLSFAEAKAGSMNFHSPSKPGAYRLFASATAEGGKRASANIPIWVK